MRLGTGAVAIVAAACVAAGCGGSDELTVTVDRTQVSIVKMLGASWTDRTPINVRLRNGSGSYYAFVILDRAGVFDVSVELTTSTSGAVWLTPLAETPGTQSGVLELKLCPDAACANVAWRTSIPYDVRTFAVAASPLVFAAAEGAASPSQTLSVTPPDVGYWLALESDRVGGSEITLDPVGWLTATRPSDSTFAVTASAATLRSGTHVARVCVGSGFRADTRACVPVTFTVTSGIATPAPQTMVLDGATPAGGNVGLLQVGFHGGLDRAWTATSDRAWLVLGQAGGASAGPLPFTVDAAAVSAMGFGAADVATVRIASSGFTEVSSTVTVRNELPEIRMVSPSAVASGRASTVTVFGKGLDRLGAAGVSVDGVGAASVTSVSATEASLSLPALDPGRRIVSVPNAFGVVTGSADLSAMPPRAWAAEFVAHSGEKRSAVYDASREAVYAVDAGANAVVRYRLTAEGWQVDQAPVSDIKDLGLSADGRTTYVTSATDTLLALDPDTLAQRGEAFVSGTDVITTPGSRAGGVQVTNDGRLWFAAQGSSRLLYFDPLRGTFARHPGLWLYDASLYAAPDGSRLWIKEPISSMPDWQERYLFVTALDEVTEPSGLPYSYSGVVFSRDGTRVVVDNEHVYDATDWTLLGHAKVSDRVGSVSVMSPDGTLVYRWAVATSATPPGSAIVVFRADEVATGTTDLVKLGELPVAGLAADCGPTPAYGCISVPILRMSPLGDALFMVGNQGLVVVPIPEAWRGP